MTEYGTALEYTMPDGKHEIVKFWAQDHSVQAQLFLQFIKETAVPIHHVFYPITQEKEAA